MSERTVTIWTCDRCGVIHEGEQGAQPKRWTAVLIAEPPRYDAHDLKRLYLCPACTGGLRGWLEPLNTVSEPSR